jgi:hypothetical protein
MLRKKSHKKMSSEKKHCREETQHFRSVYSKKLKRGIVMYECMLKS